MKLTAHKRHKNILEIFQWFERSKHCADRVIADMECLDSCAQLICPKAVELAAKGKVDLNAHKVRLRVSKSEGFEHKLEASCACSPDYWFREINTSRPICSNT